MPKEIFRVFVYSHEAGATKDLLGKPAAKDPYRTQASPFGCFSVMRTIPYNNDFLLWNVPSELVQS